MKKLVLALFIVLISSWVFAKEKVTGKVGVGGTVVEQTDGTPEFGNLYLLTDVSGSNDYVTAAGKLYYRLSLSDDVKDLDKEKTLSQKIDLKRAYIKVRPLGNEILEFGIGKLYSYYLPGNYFALSEIYTGNSRWGKTGAGVKFENYGLTLGLGFPVSETYGEFKNTFGINGAVGYDFKKLIEEIPLKIGASVLYNHTQTEVKDKPTVIDDDVGVTGSVNFGKKFPESKFSFNSTLAYSWNAEPYVASSVFKNVSNYSADGLNKSHFVSLNQTLDFSRVKFTLEGEAGHSLKNNWIPLYSGFQTVVNITDAFSVRLRLYYYAALDSENQEESRQTFEVYPRVWFEHGKWLAAAGADFAYKQTAANLWQWEWNVPFFVEYKF